MRHLVTTAIVFGVTTAPALACPPRDKCLVAMSSTIQLREAAPTPAPAVESATRALREPIAMPRRILLATDPVEMPWIWRALREQVYSQMPTYEERDHKLKIVLSPVVVTSPTDTVPGVGLAGDF